MEKVKRERVENVDLVKNGTFVQMNSLNKMIEMDIFEFHF